MVARNDPQIKGTVSLRGQRRKRRTFLEAAEQLGRTVEMCLTGTEHIAVREYRQLGELMRERGIVDHEAEIQIGLAAKLIESRGAGKLTAADVARLVDEARTKLETERGRLAERRSSRGPVGSESGG
jgi:hypothetical protein